MGLFRNSLCSSYHNSSTHNLGSFQKHNSFTDWALPTKPAFFKNNTIKVSYNFGMKDRQNLMWHSGWNIFLKFLFKNYLNSNGSKIVCTAERRQKKMPLNWVWILNSVSSMTRLSTLCCGELQIVLPLTLVGLFSHTLRIHMNINNTKKIYI